MKMYLLVTTKRKLIVIDSSSEGAKSIFKRFTKDEKIIEFRKLEILDFVKYNEPVLVLPNNEFM